MKSGVRHLTHMRSNIRKAQGYNLAEFGVALFVLVLCGIIPFTNLLLFSSSYLSVRELVNNAARKTAMAESRAMARDCANSLESQIKQPILCALHTVIPERTSLSIVAVDSLGRRIVVEENHNLPSELKPKRGSNEYKYYYHVETCSKILPLFNLASIPVIGQVPVIGGPTAVCFNAEVPLEDPLSLTR
jgi:hypothetical protein